jgi:hypothetical protein
MLTAAVKGEVRAFPDGLQHVPGRLDHGGHRRRHGCWLLHYYFLAIGRNGSVSTDPGGRLAKIRFNWLGIVASTDPSFDFAGARMIQSNLQWPSFSPLPNPQTGSFEELFTARSIARNKASPSNGLYIKLTAPPSRARRRISSSKWAEIKMTASLG